MPHKSRLSKLSKMTGTNSVSDSRGIEVVVMARAPAGAWPGKPSIVPERVLEGHGTAQDEGDGVHVHAGPSRRRRADSGTVLVVSSMKPMARSRSRAVGSS